MKPARHILVGVLDPTRKVIHDALVGKTLTKAGRCSGPDVDGVIYSL